jgi:undecaprenyl-diphosphatase
MDLFDALLLGVLQGLTEFLPISSSGHLVIGQYLLHIDLPGNALEVVLHLGTLGSVLLVFWRDLVQLLGSLRERSTQRYLLILVIGTVPAVIIGFTLKETIESAFDQVPIVGGALLLTGIVLILTRWIPVKNQPVTFWKGLLVGIAQAIAIIPGISRSGTTISTALFLGIRPEEAARFSFLLAIPAIAGAGLLTFMDLVQSEAAVLPFSVLLMGFTSSLVVGWLALRWLLGLLQRGKFHWFGSYCLALGLLALAV